jgi:hypothetical protein
MKSRGISKSTKLKIYRTIIRPIVTHGCEGWIMSEHMEEALRVWERKILRRVCGQKRTQMDEEFIQTRNYKINIEVLI